IGRAPDEPESAVGERLVRPGPAGELLGVARPEEVGAEALAVLLVGENVALRGIRLEVVEPRHRLGGVAEGGVPGDVADALAADIDLAAVPHPLELLLAADQHVSPYVARASSIARNASTSLLKASGCSISAKRRAPGIQAWRKPGRCASKAGLSGEGSSLPQMPRIGQRSTPISPMRYGMEV